MATSHWTFQIQFNEVVFWCNVYIVCKQLGRNCYTMERDPKYIDGIIDRWENLTGKTAIKINEGEEIE